MKKGSDTNTTPVVQHEGAFTDSMLARRIWDRYGISPGVIQRDRVLQRANYAAQFGVSRFPLLVDVQRRWAPKGTHISRDWSVLPYVRRTSSPSDEDTLSLHPQAREAQRLPSAQVVPSLGSGIQRDIQPKETPVGSKFAEDLTMADRSTETGPATEVRRSVAEGEISTPAAIGTDSLGSGIVQRRLKGPAGRAMQHQTIGSTVEMRAPYPAAIGPGGLGRVIMRRRAGTSPGQTVQERPVVPKPAGSVERTIGARPETSPLPVHTSTGTDQLIGRADIASFATAGTGDLGTVIIQRSLKSPAQRAMPLYQGFSSPKLGRREDRGAAEDKRVSPPSPTASGVQHAAETQVSLPAMPSTNHLGTILRRRLGSSAEQAVRGQSIDHESRAEAKTGMSPDAITGNLGPFILQRHRSNPVGNERTRYPVIETRTTTPVLVGTGGPGDPGVQRKRVSYEPSTTTEQAVAGGWPGSGRSSPLPAIGSEQPPAATESAATVATGRDVGASILRRYMGGPLEQSWLGPLAMLGARSFFAGADVPGFQPVAETGPLGSRTQAPTPGFNDISNMKGVSLQRYASNPIGGLKHDAYGGAYSKLSLLPPMAAPSGPAVQWAGVFGSVVHAEDGSHPSWPEMPLARAGDYSNKGVGRGRTPTPWAPGAPPGVLQRASAGESDQTPTGRSPDTASPQNIGASLPFLSGVKQSGTEMPDLEQLVDRIYPLIERRLIIRLSIEKENRGL